MNTKKLLALILLFAVDATRAQSDTEDDTTPTPASTTTTAAPSTTPPRPPPSYELLRDSMEFPADYVICSYHLYNRKVSDVIMENAELPSFYDSVQTAAHCIFVVPDCFNGKLRKWKDIVEAYLGLAEPYNVIFCDWGAAYDPNYLVAAMAVQHVAERTAAVIERIWANQAAGDWRTEMVGHGLGAHICGAVGKNIALIGPLTRIIGLDPRALLFTSGYDVCADQALNASDAQQVQCWHTNMNGLGTNQGLGRYNFLFNGGGPHQREIVIFETENYMSHGICVDFFLESINSKLFVAKGPYSLPAVVISPFLSNKTPPGRYNVKTHSKPPYGMG